MAFGLTPRYSRELLLDNISEYNFLVLALDTAKKMNWKISRVTENGFTAYGKLAVRSTGEEIDISVDGDTAYIESKCLGSQMFDWGVNKKHVERFITSFNNSLASITDEELAVKWQELQPTLEAEKEKAFQKGEITKGNFFSLFIPVKGYTITPVLIDLNILIFILMVISGANIMLPDNQTLIAWGANFRPLTLEGEWWRLLTSCFVHVGILHLLLNMYALLYIGLLLEPRLGTQRFLAAYLLTGLASSVNSIWWHELTISVGASGAIFGLYGVFFAMLTTNLIEKTARKALLTSIGIFVLFNLANGLKSGIDNAAHIGGLLSGLMIGYAYYPGLRKPVSKRFQYITISILTVFILVTSFVICANIPNDVGKYDEGMQTFAANENNALLVYNATNNNTPLDSLKMLVLSGINDWNKNIILLNNIDKLKLPDEVHKRDIVILDYCNLRLKSFQLLYKKLEENSTAYDANIEAYNNNIQHDLYLLSQLISK